MLLNTYNNLSELAPIQYVFYVSPHASSRMMGYYGVNSVPRHYTDGILVRVGSGNYANYVNDYLSRRAVSAPLRVEVVQKTLTSTTAYVKVKVTLEESLPAGHDIYIGFWEDYVVVGGTYGNTPVRVLERDLATTALTITNPGQSQEFEYTFSASGYKQNDLGFTAWVQGPNTDPECHGAVAAKFVSSAVSPSSLGRVKIMFR